MPKQVLLADDSVTIQKVIGITFANEDVALTTVDNGTEAIATARRLKPDLILADVVMPGKNGYEVCDYVKHDPELRATPVLLLAGTFESFDEAEMGRVGADGYITKPFESQALIDKVHELIARTQGGRAPQPQPRPQPKGAPAPAAAPPSAARPDEFHLDDFSPFDEAPAEIEAAEPAAGATEGGLGPDAGGTEEEVWDLSDFEPGAEAAGSASDADPLVQGAAEAAAEENDLLAGDTTFGGEDDFGGGPQTDGHTAAPGDGAAGAQRGVEGESVFDFSEETPGEATLGDDALGEDDPFGTAGPGQAADPFADESPEVLELEDIEEVGDGADLGAADDDLAAESEGIDGDSLVAPGAADGWEVAPVADVRTGGRRAAKGGGALGGGEVGALAARIQAAAEGLVGHARVPVAGLPAEQVEAIVAKVAREVIEEVAWEVVPDLCESLIRQEIRKITGK